MGCEGRLFSRNQEFLKLVESQRNEIQKIGEALTSHRGDLVKMLAKSMFSQVEGILAKDLVAWLIEKKHVKDRKESVQMGVNLVNGGFLYENDLNTQGFEDGSAVWKLTSDLPKENVPLSSILQKCTKAGPVVLPGGLFKTKTQYLVFLSSELKAIFYDNELGIKMKTELDLRKYSLSYSDNVTHGLKLESSESKNVQNLQFRNKVEQDAWLNELMSSGMTYIENTNATAKTANSFYEFNAHSIDGNDVSMETYRGKVILVTNLASNCGLTVSNYTQLVELDNLYRDKGLVILAFPCNQFGGQEPGSPQEIVEFVKKFGVQFPMMEKVDVNGPTAHPIFVYLKSKLSGNFGSFIKWNFTKFLIDRNGIPYKRYGPKDAPRSFEDDIIALLDN